MIEGQQHRNECEIPAQKYWKPDTVPTTFPKPSNESNTSNNGCSSTTPQGRPCSARREKDWQIQGVNFKSNIANSYKIHKSNKINE